MSDDGRDVVLRLDGVSKKFRRRWALRDCSLEVSRGRVSALVGPNGAGKTTLLMLATGLLRPTTGTVAVLGAAPTRAGMPAGASFLAHDKPLYQNFQVAEMLSAAAALNSAGHWDAGYAAGLVADAGIGINERIRALTPGQRARVALAIALGRRPELLLLDEPLSELDPLARKQVMGTLLAEVAETGMTVLLSSHVISDLEESCDHLALLRDGQVRLSGDIGELLANHRRLTGPVSRGRSAVAASAVVHESSTDRQTSAMVHGPLPAVPAGFQVESPTLDELVLAYLQAAPATQEMVAS